MEGGVPRSELEWLGLELALGRYFVGAPGDAKAAILARLCRWAGKPVSFSRLAINTAVTESSVKTFVHFLRQDMIDLGFRAQIVTHRKLGAYSISPDGAAEVIGRVGVTLEHLGWAA